MIIFIPSKGRSAPGMAKTAINLTDQGLPFNLVVEPQEAEAYKASYSEANILVLEESNQGIAYVRNAILKLARGFGYGSFWMLDDDITAVYRQVLGKNVKSTFEDILGAAERLFYTIPEAAQGALEYQQFSWSAKKPHVLNSYCDVAVWIHVKRTLHVNYRPFVNLKEDRDFTLQVLFSGYNTCRASQLGFSAPKNGSNPGGLQEFYAQSGRELEAVKRMCSLWPEYVTRQTKSDGRIDCKINWKKFKRA